MTIDYQIDENDFLTHQLFVASKSSRIRKKRQRNKIIFALIYIVFGLLSFLQDKVSLAIFFFIIGLLWFLFTLYAKGGSMSDITRVSLMKTLKIGKAEL